MSKHFTWIHAPFACNHAPFAWIHAPCFQHQVPEINLPIVDVRDVALGHLKVMTLPEAADHRHIMYSDSVWVQDIAKVGRLAVVQPMQYTHSLLYSWYSA